MDMFEISLEKAAACLDLAILGDFSAKDSGALFIAAEVALPLAATAGVGVISLTSHFARNLWLYCTTSTYNICQIDG